MTDEPQKPHQRKERVASDPPGTKRAVKLEAGPLLEDGLRSRRHAELNIAICGSDPDQRIQKRVCAHNVPAGSMFLNQHRLCEARVEMSLRAVNLNAGSFLNDPAHAVMLFSTQSVSV